MLTSSTTFQPTASQRASFEDARDRAFGAMQAGELETFLERSEDALQVLPEDDSTHAERAEVMQSVGVYEVDARTHEQLVRSKAIVERYIDKLHSAYGEAAETRRAWKLAQEYTADLQRRIDETEATPLAPAIPPAHELATGNADGPKPFPPSGVDHADDGRAGNGLLIAGSISLGVGVVLIVVAGVHASYWASAHSDYRALEREFDGSDGDATRKRQLEGEWNRQRDRALGTGIPGLAVAVAGSTLLALGVRARKAGPPSIGFSTAGLRVRF